MLPPATETLWSFLQTQPALAGFILVGGSALALRIRHRISEDLDLAFPGLTLPRARLEALNHALTEAGFQLERDDNEAALQEFLLGGMELHDYQQDFIANSSVRLSFFTADSALSKVLAPASQSGVRVASLPELFKAKCLVSAVRSKTRDWLDLYVLFREHGFSAVDYRDAFRQAGILSQADIGLSRLCSGLPQTDDEGYAHLLANAPTLAEMTNFFVAQRNELEIQLADEARRGRHRQ